MPIPILSLGCYVGWDLNSWKTPGMHLLWSKLKLDLQHLPAIQHVSTSPRPRVQSVLHTTILPQADV